MISPDKELVYWIVMFLVWIDILHLVRLRSKLK